MKRSSLMISLLVLAAAIALMTFSAAPIPANAGGLRLQATPTKSIEIEPVDPTPTAKPPVIGTPTGPGQVGGTPVPPPIKFTPPPTFDDLLAQFPDLKPYLDRVKDLGVAELDFAEMYGLLVTIYTNSGATGVATFLKDSGLLDKMGIPVAYLDLLFVYDKGGLQAVDALARERGYINKKNELVAYFTLNSKDNLEAVKKVLNDDFGVSAYGFNDATQELEVGISLELLAQFQTPGTLLGYLVQVATIEHVEGVRPPAPPITGGLLQGRSDGVAATIGADAWHAAGFTGKGVRVGILDLGFGGVKALIGRELPTNTKTIFDLDEMDAQDDNHGTAVAAVAARVAPEAEFYLASFDGSSDTALAEALQWLEDNKVQVVNYSVSSIVGPRDGTSNDVGLVELFMRRTGALWVNSSGNYAEGHTLFEFNPGPKNIHYYNEETNLLPFVAYAPVTSISMQWNGNWKGRENNEYIMVVLDKNGNEVATANEKRRGARNAFPFQFLNIRTEPGELYYLLVARTNGKVNNIIDVVIVNSEVADWAKVPQYSLTTPADAPSAIVVGALSRDGSKLEPYSSQGPTTDERLKPDVTAPTRERVPGYEERGFSGTSGSAPVVTGAAALVLQAFPDKTASEVKAYLMENVVDLGDKGPDPVFGAGMIKLPAPEGGAPVVAEPPTNEPSATISDIKARFNVNVRGVRGIALNVTFKLVNYSGKKLALAAVFGTPDGEPIPATDERYDLNGALATFATVTVKRNQTTFKDVPLFIPNSAFADVESKEILYVVAIFDITDKDNVTRLAITDEVKLRIRK